MYLCGTIENQLYFFNLNSSFNTKLKVFLELDAQLFHMKKINVLLLATFFCFFVNDVDAKYDRISEQLNVSVYPKDRPSQRTQQREEDYCYDWAQHRIDDLYNTNNPGKNYRLRKNYYNTCQNKTYKRKDRYSAKDRNGQDDIKRLFNFLLK